LERHPTSGIHTPQITFEIFGYVRISLGYPWDIRFSKDIPGISLTYPIFSNFQIEIIFVASKTNFIGLGNWDDSRYTRDILQCPIYIILRCKRALVILLNIQLVHRSRTGQVLQVQLFKGAVEYQCNIVLTIGACDGPWATVGQWVSDGK
jgi:hypothetical protein